MSPTNHDPSKRRSKLLKAYRYHRKVKKTKNKKKCVSIILRFSIHNKDLRDEVYRKGLKSRYTINGLGLKRILIELTDKEVYLTVVTLS